MDQFFKAVDKGEYVIGIFRNFTKAFDRQTTIFCYGNKIIME